MTTFIKCHNKNDWNDYVLDNGGHPLQLWGWGEVKAVHGWTAERMLLHGENDEVLGGAQVLIKRLPWPLKSFAYVPRGPVVDEANREELLSSLCDFIKEEYRSVAVSIEPDAVEYQVPHGWRYSKNRILPAETIILDLTRPESELLNDMAKKTRQYIRKSASEDMTIERVRSKEDLDKCLDIYRQTAKRAKFDIHDNQYYYDIFSKMADYSQLFASYVDDQPVAFLWIAISADTAFQLYGGMNEKGQELRCNYALKWHAIRKCKEWGLLRYDFGGLIGGGVTTFKMGWTETETTLAGTFDKPLSAKYKLWSRGMPAGKRTMRRIRRLFKR